MSIYFDIETMIQAWLKTTYLAALLARADGGISVFKAMPNAAPLPALVLSRVGGAPALGIDMPEDVARISCDCWAKSRDAAVDLSLTLVSVIEELAPSGGYTDGHGRLAVAETVSWLWMPDKASDTPRYVVDALFTAIPG
jgi:hypothetical protein